MASTTSGTYDSLQAFIASLPALGGGLEEVQIPDAEEIESGVSNALQGVRGTHMVKDYFDANPGEAKMQVRVVRLSDDKVSDWGSFEDATAFLQQSPAA